MRRRGLSLLGWFSTRWLSTGSDTKSDIISSLCRAIKAKSVAQGKRLHSQAIEHNLQSDPGIQNHLIQMYSACGVICEARTIFDSMPTPPHVTSWNMLISAYGQAGLNNEAERLYDLHPYKNDSSRTTMVIVFSRAGNKSAAKAMFDSIEQPSTIACNSLISLYARTGELHEAESLFRSMPAPNVVTNNTMITGLASTGRVVEAKKLFDGMLDRTTVSWNAMITAFAQNGDIDQAERLFKQTPEKNVISWNTMIAGYGQNGRPDAALGLFKRMDVEGILPNKLTYCSVLDACANLAAAVDGRIVHQEISQDILRDTQVANTVCNMYGKCGLPEIAREVFLGMHQRDIVSWTAILAAFGQNGYSPQALEVFRLMIQYGEEPNEITLINTLSACGHGGLYDEGCEIFDCVTREDFSYVAPNESHFVCMIDLLGRAGYLDAAETLANKMPYAAGAVAWTSLLSACRTYRDMKRAGKVAKLLFQLDTKPVKDPAPYVMLSNIYASAGNRAEEIKVREEMKIKCGKKLPGKSTISIGGRVNDFYSLDESHPRRDEAYAELRRLMEEMKTAGYVAETRKAEMEEEETEQSLTYHSEKLAVAYGVAKTSAGAPLCIVKNLRVCSDCHNVIKFMSKMLNRRIAVRDSTRFHHFDNGFCSCRDYW